MPLYVAHLRQAKIIIIYVIIVAILFKRSFFRCVSVILSLFFACLHAHSFRLFSVCLKCFSFVDIPYNGISHPRSSRRQRHGRCSHTGRSWDSEWPPSSRRHRRQSRYPRQTQGGHDVIKTDSARLAVPDDYDAASTSRRHGGGNVTCRTDDVGCRREPIAPGLGVYLGATVPDRRKHQPIRPVRPEVSTDNP